MSNFLSRSELFSVNIFTNPTIATCDFFARELGTLIGRQHSQFFLHTNVCFLSRGPSQHTLARQSGVCLMPANSHRTMHNVQCLLLITLHIAQCTMFNVYCTMSITLHIAQCTMHNVHCTLRNAQCTALHMLHFLIACSPSYCILIEMSFDAICICNMQYAICIDPSAVFFTAAVVTYTSDNCLFSLCLPYAGRKVARL